MKIIICPKCRRKYENYTQVHKENNVARRCDDCIHDDNLERERIRREKKKNLLQYA
jgi:hypothetical protein